MDHKAWPWKKKSTEKSNGISSNEEVSKVDINDNICVFLVVRLDNGSLLCTFLRHVSMVYYLNTRV